MSNARRNSRFHETLTKIYFPPLPPRNLLKIDVQRKKEETGGSEFFDSSKSAADDDDLEKEHGDCSPTEDEGSESNKKLTRSQRKRIRKKKLKEAAAASPALPIAKRRKMIGPLLPTSDVSSLSCQHLQAEDAARQARKED